MHDATGRGSATEGTDLPTPISLRVRDVAALWGVGERYVWHLVLSEEKQPGTGLKSLKLGTRRLVRYEDAKAYIDHIANEGTELRERAKAGA